ncbi:MAG: hypothetical protein COV45_03040 [Deltaproteobacteria bacterium CG11_big_fil_rev_8_21_14_0_20_47_16]|nr:MAG: hypothetical protein COV45_03040 [Deltaproteobacteria bacterium CG11_big_fil_rev_8_21_14_0_20_47_16]
MAPPRLQPVRLADYLPWKRRDDPRLAELVTVVSDIKQVKEGDITIVGIPDDRGVAVNHGRIGARFGPAIFRQCFYRLPIGAEGELQGASLLDVGDVLPESTIEATHEALRQVVAALHRRGATVIVLGGGHDTAYGSLMGLRDFDARSCIVNLDAHLDVRGREPDGQIGSGTTFRRLIEEGQVLGKDIYMVGYQSHSNTAAHVHFAREQGMHLWSWRDLSQGGRLKVLTDLVNHWVQSKSVGVSWDMDSIIASAAPGVSASAVVGFSAEESLYLAELLGAHHAIRQLEIMEINPKVDGQAITARLAAVVVWHFIAARLKDRIRA